MTAKVSPKIVSHDEWLSARKALLAEEKKLSQSADAVAAQLRSLPMEAVTKDYTFLPASSSDTDESKKMLSLSDLFAGKHQLIVYHFMFAPGSDAGCPGCSFMGDHIPATLAHLRARDTQFAAVSRAAPAALAAYRARCAWSFPWYSAGDGDFAYDFHATLDEGRAPLEYNYEGREALVAERARENEAAAAASGTEGEGKGRGRQRSAVPEGDQPALSVFYRGDDGKVYHTYSTYARGLERLLGTLTMLDMTPLGRQDEEFGACEFKRNYEYGDE